MAIRKKKISKKRRPKSDASNRFEALEPRRVLSGSNALDRLDFGNLAEEAAHNFEPGYALSQMPIRGTGAVGASAGQTYREAVGDGGASATAGSSALIFTMAVDPVRQNYLSIRLWGSDTPGGAMYLVNASFSATNSPIDENGDPPSFPDRFYYDTIPIPISWTQGHTSVQMTLSAYSDYDAYGGTGYHLLAKGQVDRPIYSVYTHTDPAFIPDSSDPTGTKPTQTGAVTLGTVTASQADAILLAERKSLYNSGNYFDDLVAQQALVLNSTANADGTYGWTAPTGAPPEVVGLDMFTNLASWMNTHSGASADTWRDRIASQIPAPGYTAVPDELLSALTATYLLPPLQNSAGNLVTGQGTLDHYHDPKLIARIVAALDGVSYEQDSDGGFIQQGNTVAAGSNSAWTGLTSTARSGGTFNGSKARQTTVHGGGDLQGVDAQGIGLALINLLNDPTAASLLQIYLSQKYDENLTLNPTTYVLRATAYEQMLYNDIVFLTTHTGGTESQNLFQMSNLYASQIALEKLQVLFPNATYSFSESSALNYVKQVMGMVPDTLRGPGSTGSTNFGVSASGMGEADGVLDGGYDGGYGLWLTYLLPQIAAMGSLDPGIDSTTLLSFQNIARASIDSYDQFISPQENATINSSGVVTADQWLLGQDDFITYRNVHNPNYNSTSLSINTRYPAANASGSIHDAYALRSAYLDIEYGITPATTADSHVEPHLNFLRDLSAYESTIHSLVNVNPTTLTPLPGESGQPDYTWADMQLGSLAFTNRGERVYLQMNWRNSYVNGGNYSSVGNVARIEDTTDSVLRAAMIIMPKDSADVQSDGNLTSSSYNGAWVVRYGDYLIVLNKSTSTYSAKFPNGVGWVQDLVSHNYYAMGTNATVNVAAGQYAIFWLNAGSVVGGLGTTPVGSDIGAVGISGSNSYANGIYTVTGAGADIGGTADAFRFVSTSESGDSTIIAQIASQSAANSLAASGVMIRNGLAANATFAEVVRTPGGGLRFEYRTDTGNVAAWDAAALPLGSVWVKLTRSGNNVSGFYSADGVNWTQIGVAQSISLPTTAQIGLAVSSHSVSATATSTFANVNITGGLAPTVAVAASSALVTSGGNANKQANLSVLGADNSGEAGLTYTWTMLSGPDAVSYSTNGTNAAKNTTVTFAATGTYVFRVLIKDAGGAIITNDVTVLVPQVLGGLNVTPNSGANYLGNSGLQQFTATATDQFGAALPSASVGIVWSLVSGSVGSLNSTGLYTAPTTGGGNATVKATVGTISGTAMVTIIGIFTASQDIGAPAITGSVSYSTTNGGTYTVAGNGTDIWVPSDQFRFVYVPVTGDATITAHVVSISNSDTALGFAKSGVMFRASLDSTSPYILMSQTYSKGPNFQWRLSNGSVGQSYVGSGTNTGWVRVVRVGNTFTTYYSADGVTWSQNAVNTQTISMGATLYVGLAVTSRNGSTVNTSVFDNVTIQTTASTPTFPNDLDIGSPSPGGTYTETGGTATITAGGSDIFSNADHFNYAYMPITGNATLTARVVSLVNTNTNAKAGVMIRNTLDSGSIEASTLVTASNGINFDSRSSTNGSSSETKVSSLAAPYWVRITRTLISGNSYSLSSFRSADNVTWTQIGTSKTITMNSTAFIGLAVTSHDDGTATTAVFDNITVTATSDAAPTVATAAAAAVNPVTGTTVGLGALGTDSDDVASNLTYSWSVRPYPASTPAVVAFSASGTNAAKNTTATFTRAGTYVIDVIIADLGGLTVTSSVTVTVNQTLTSIAVSPSSSSVSPLGSQQFSATALDQFGQPMANQPTFTWAVVSGNGSVNSSGLYTAPLTGSSATVRATAGISGSATVTIVNQAPLLANSAVPTVGINTYVGAAVPLTALGVDDTGETNLTYTWSVVGTPPAPVTFGENGDNAAKNSTATFTKPGIYALQLVAADPGGQLFAVGLTANVTYLRGDINGDGQRNVADISALMMALANLSSFQIQLGLQDNTNLLAVADANQDSAVNNLDISALISLVANDIAAGGSVPLAGVVPGNSNQQAPIPSIADRTQPVSISNSSLVGPSPLPSESGQLPAANVAPVTADDEKLANTLTSTPVDAVPVPTKETAFPATGFSTLATDLLLVRRSVSTAPKQTILPAQTRPPLEVAQYCWTPAAFRARHYSGHDEATASEQLIDDLLAGWPSSRS